jgi:hypothetical protein
MTASIELLVVLMVVLLVTASGLIIYLVRAWRKNAAEEASPEVPSEREVSGEVSAGLHIPEGRVADVPGETVAALRSQEGPAESGQPMPVPETTALVGQTEATPEPGTTLLMQVWQDSEGYLVVEADGQRYRRLFDIRDGEVGRRVLETINRLATFSRGRESRVVSAAPPQKPAARPVAPSLPEAAVDEEAQMFFEELRQKEEAPRKIPRIATDPVPFRRSGPAQQPGITLNLAEEIDRMLQIRIAAAPEFSGRRVHVVTAPDGALRFQADGISYTALDEIPDPQVQALIRAAIADWEARR